jgi:hypothetical protein
MVLIETIYNQLQSNTRLLTIIGNGIFSILWRTFPPENGGIVDEI